MKTHFALRDVLLVGAVLAGSLVRCDAQAVQSLDSIKSQEELTRAITTLDAQLFDAYNTCNLEKFSSFFVDGVEFYHDQGGVTLGKENLTEAIKQNICGKVHRDLVPGTLAVYPLKGYGAVETGIHLFCDPKSTGTTGKCGDGSGVARFTHLWQNKDGAWKITRVISYDHKSSGK